MQKPFFICIMPIKNESWILGRSLKCNSLWADKIIIADQSDNDECRKIAKQFPKVKYIANTSSKYSEHERQNILLKEARLMPKPRVIFSLDADEVLSANYAESREWQTVHELPEGTAIYIPRVEILPDVETYWIANSTGLLRGYIDDGRELQGMLIHGPLLPLTPQTPWLMFKDIKLLHYQYAEWGRMDSKHRWYLCFERLINRPGLSSITAFRVYRHMYSVPLNKIKSINPLWFKQYQGKGIDMTSIRKSGTYWYDREVIKWFDEYGTKKFSREAIWDVNWTTIGNQLRCNHEGKVYKDPRHLFQRVVHKWLRETQNIHTRWYIVLVDSLLKKLGW